MAAAATSVSTTAIGIVPAPETDSVFKPALLLMSGRTVAFAATFFIPLVLARVFDPAQFGTYKQLFLIWGTVYYIAQLGMASSLYYFLPRAPRMAGSYVANSLLFLAASGLVCLGALVIAAPKLGRWLSNNELPQYLPWIGLYVFLMMVSMALEVVLISRGRYLWASATYAISDIARGGGLHRAGAAVPAARVAPERRRDSGRPSGCHHTLLLPQGIPRQLQTGWGAAQEPVGVCAPFGLAVVVEILQASLPQYVVSHLFDPATFAIFAVGCLQIPLVDFAASPTSDVMMVKMQERLAKGRTRAVLEIWHDTTWKLALLFLPLAAFLMVDAREIIVFLFTKRYSASAPIFMVWSAMILLASLQVDGVMRVFAQTRFLLVLNLMRLAIIAG